MSFAYDWIKGLVQAAADATSDDLVKWMLGSDANDPVRYPPAWSKSTKMRERGSLWDSLAFPAILTQVGTELDTHGVCWAYFSTNDGAAPTIFGNSRIASVAKDTGLQELTVTFSPAYTGMFDFICFSVLDDVPSHQILVSRDASYVTVKYEDNIGGLIPIANHNVCFAAIGLR